jgi:hypothetical protein
MLDNLARLDDRMLTRRELLRRSGTGFGALALAGLLASEETAPAQSDEALTSPLTPRVPHFPAKAKRVVHLFMNGGPSHIDTFDPKPALAAYAARHPRKPLQSGNLVTERKTGAALPSPFKFRKHGQSGIEVSDIFPHIASHIDDICVIRSMYANVPNHEPSLMLMNCGSAGFMARPSIGSWVTYGLGAENQNLPAFIALCPGGYPTNETQNWQSAFLPGVYQGTYIDSKQTDLGKLIENIKNHCSLPSTQERQLKLLRQLNRLHNQPREDAQLEARIQSFELAYRMQMEAADAFDLGKERRSIRALYGSNTQGRQLLIARRLLERGVRYVQVWSGQGQPWDDHEDIKHHAQLAGECDRAIGALLQDLKQRGMLDSTLVLWGGEFGRTPTVEIDQKDSKTTKKGRDHNHYGFSVWLAGGGVKGGYVHGATDEFGFQAVENKVHVHDLHATILHLLGFDHERLTYRYAGRNFRLTDVYGHVVKEVLA